MHDMTRALLITAAALLLLYAAACTVRPTTACLCRAGVLRLRPRPARPGCWLCRGTGVRFRVGRRLWNWARGTARDTR